MPETCELCGRAVKALTEHHLYPKSQGRRAGLVTDERARVLRPDGSVIPGLYAAGNVSSAVMGRTYAGPGATIGPALTFGYLAAEAISQES